MRMARASMPSEAGYVAFQKATGYFSLPNENTGRVSFVCMTVRSLSRSPERAASRMRSRMRATRGGSRERSRTISGTAAPSAAERSAASPVGARVCARSSPAGGASTINARTRRSSMDGPFDSEQGRVANGNARVKPRRTMKIELLPQQGEREFAVADAGGQVFRIARRRVLAVGGDELGERGEQRGLRQAVLVDAIEARLGPSLPQIAQRAPFLLVIGRRLETRRTHPHHRRAPSNDRIACPRCCVCRARRPSQPPRLQVSMRAR